MKRGSSHGWKEIRLLDCLGVNGRCLFGRKRSRFFAGGRVGGRTQDARRAAGTAEPRAGGGAEKAPRYGARIRWRGTAGTYEQRRSVSQQERRTKDRRRLPPKHREQEEG